MTTSASEVLNALEEHYRTEVEQATDKFLEIRDVLIHLIIKEGEGAIEKRNVRELRTAQEACEQAQKNLDTIIEFRSRTSEVKDG